MSGKVSQTLVKKEVSKPKSKLESAKHLTESEKKPELPVVVKTEYKILASLRNGSCLMLDYETKSTEHMWSGLHDNASTSISILPEKNLFVSASSDSSIRVVDLTTRQVLRTIHDDLFCKFIIYLDSKSLSS